MHSVSADEPMLGDRKGIANALSAVQLLSDMYYREKSLDPNGVSLQSSFICMLHLANEEGLKFEQADTFDDDPRHQMLAESDFTIRRVPQPQHREMQQTV